jgi:minor extracellular serine protease Vpr
MPMYRVRLASIVAVASSFFLGAGPPTFSNQTPLSPSRTTQALRWAAPANASDSVEAIVTLGSEPIASMLQSTGLTVKHRGSIDFESDQAIAYERQLESEQADFISRVGRAVPGVRIKAQLRVLANAVSLDCRRSDLPVIAGLPGVQSVEIARTCRPSLNRSVGLISAPAMWARLGGQSVAGDGVKIAVIDTGIDVSSPAMSDVGMTAPSGFPRGNSAFTNNKVIVAKSFLPGSDSTPADQFGHGTAVAAVAAGSLNTQTIIGPISGVAPRAFLGNYRVLDENGIGSEAQVAAGLEEALKDGFDVANISLGTKSNGTLSFLGNTVEKAVAAGMTVVAAAGNQGGNGKQTIDSPAEAPSAIAVGASGNQHIVTSGLIVAGPAPLPGDFGRDSGTFACCGSLSGAIGPLPCVDVSAIDPSHDGCNGLAAGSLSGKIALLQNSRSDCLMLQKLTAARAAGAAAAVVFSLDSSVGTSPGDLQTAGIPSILIDSSQGRALRTWVRQHPDAPVAVSPAVEFVSDSDTDVSETFSGLGPSGLGQLKPDVDAPGANIFTASTTSLLGFGIQSGTSLSTPHVAGAAALVKQLHPSWTPDRIKSALMSSADPVFSNAKRTDTADALTAGAGRINLDQAGSVTATFLPASLTFGFKKLKPKSAITPAVADFKITNQAATTAAFNISAQSDDSLGVDLSASSVTLEPGQSASVTVTIVVLARKGANNRDHTGNVLIQGPGGQVMHIPYWVRFGTVN